MKTRRILFSILIFFSFYILSSQTPQGFNYQAIARDASGNQILNANLQVKLAVMGDSLGSTIYWEELFNPVTTNAFGLFTVILGRGTRQATSTVATFQDLNWRVTPVFVRTQIYYPNVWKNMGSSRLWSVPYALSANDVTGPLQKLKVTGTTTSMDSALFEVKNNTGQTIFAVYNEGVRIYVDDGTVKGSTKGGFAIGGFGTAKGTSQEYLRVTRDSTRVYVNQLAKGSRKGGFAIGGFSPAKGADTTGFLNLTPQNYFIGYGAGNLLNPGLYNSFMGYHAGINTTGSYNTFIGYKAGTSNTTGTQNVFMGYQAGYSDTASYNIFIGNQSGYSNIQGTYNAFIGYQSGQQNITGNGNVYIGQQAGSKITAGLSNVFLGTYSALNKTSGSRNIFLGSGSGMSSLTGNDNIFLGTFTGNKTTSDYNIFIGNLSGFNNTSGQYNIFAGYAAGLGNRKGNYNIYFGNNAGLSDTTGNWNIFFGDGAGYTNTGSNNLIFGYQAGYYSTVGGYNLIMGTQAGAHNTGDNNMFMGYQAGWTNTSGANNVFLGPLSGGYNSTGSNNIYIGNQAGYLSTTGGQNISVGTQAGYSTTTGVSNIFLGYQAGFYNSTGMQNNFQGSQAGFNNKTGYNNVFIGSAAGQSNTDGYNNVFLGMQTGNKNTTGNFNTSLGYLAGFSNQTGSLNVFVGNNAGYYETGSNKLYIENTITDMTGALIYGEFDNNYLRLNANTDIYGRLAIGKSSPAANLDVIGGSWDLVNGEGDFKIGDATYRLKFGVANAGGGAGDARINAQGGTNRLILGAGSADVLLVTNSNVLPWTNNFSSLGTATNKWTAVYATNGTIQTSDLRLKTNIKDITYGLSTILQLEPVSFTWKDEKEGKTRLGLIAQDVEKVINEVVDKGNDPAQTLGINYSELVPVLIRGMQDQQKQIESIRLENSELKSSLKNLESEINLLKTRAASNSNR
jgi:hypothetical protein